MLEAISGRPYEVGGSGQVARWCNCVLRSGAVATQSGTEAFKERMV